MACLTPNIENETPHAATQLQNRDYPAGTQWILQITDTHLYADPAGCLLGVNTLDTLRQNIELIMQEGWHFDMVLTTGDLVHDASPEGYRRLAEELARLDRPIYALPGNHDVPETMTPALAQHGITFCESLTTEHWQLILLDTHIPDDEGGRLSPDEMARLRDFLANSDRHVLVCMHHQPLPVGSRWLDTMVIKNGPDFLSAVQNCDNVRALLFGHIHQSYDCWEKKLRLLATPSTCIQFKPGSGPFAVDPVPPGFRLLALLPDGSIETTVVRVADTPSGLDMRSIGY